MLSQSLQNIIIFLSRVPSGVKYTLLLVRKLAHVVNTIEIFNLHCAICSVHQPGHSSNNSKIKFKFKNTEVQCVSIKYSKVANTEHSPSAFGAPMPSFSRKAEKIYRLRLYKPSEALSLSTLVNSQQIFYFLSEAVF